MFTRIPIRSKLALALAIPVLAMFVVSIYEVSEASQKVEQVQQDTDLAAVALGPGSLIAALQNERNDSATTVTGLRSSLALDTEDLAETQRDTDTASVAFRETLAKSGSEAQAVYSPVLKKLDESLASIRAETAEFMDSDAFKGPDSINLEDATIRLSNQQWDAYSVVIDDFQAANIRVSLSIDDPELRSAVLMLDGVSRTIENLAVMIRTGIISSLTDGEVQGTTLNDVNASITRFEDDLDRVGLLATGSYADEAQSIGENPAFDVTVDLLRGYLNKEGLDTSAILESANDSGEGGAITPEALRDSAASALETRSNDLLDEAETRQRNFIALALLVLVVGGAFMVIAARSITRPLLSLTKQADDMAANRLPSAVQQILDTPLGDDVVIPDVAPIEVKTRDEVQDVAVALNSVQSSALDLAVEQAVLRRNIADSFVNLGRRTQNLISRQLDFITELERNETDPATLNNLFKLDHLATRARRNAESLVVLAGLVTPRTWGAPIPMGDVIRAALGEVEDYQRVEVRPIGDALVPGATASDLVHLLAEMVENGLSFSPPGRPVEVHGRMTKNGYVLAVIDQGIGMTSEEIESANDRLAGRESYTVAPSRYLGHYVAGNLAQRIGVAVTLSESPTGGISAKIVIPKAVLDAVPAMPGEAPLAQTATPGGNDGPHTPLAVPASTDGVSPSSQDDSVPTTEHGLRRRVRRPDMPNGSATNGNGPGGPGPSRTAPVETPRPPATVAPAAEPQAAPKVPVTASIDAKVGAAPTPPSGPVVVEAKPSAVPAGATASPVATTPVGSTTLASTTPSKGAPATTTANGLRKRVPGDQLAASTLAPSIPRGQATKAANEEAGTGEPGEQAPADSMFSLLSTFESGVQRGRTDLSQTADADAPSPDSDREV